MRSLGYSVAHISELSIMLPVFGCTRNIGMKRRVCFMQMTHDGYFEALVPFSTSKEIMPLPHEPNEGRVHQPVEHAKGRDH